MCQVTKICSDIQINKNMCHYWNDCDKFTWNEFGFKSDWPLLIEDCSGLKLFTIVQHTSACCPGREHSCLATLEWSRMRQIMAIYYLKLIIIVSCFDDMLGSHRAVVRSSFFQNKIR